MGVLSYFLEFLAFSLIIVSLGAVAVLFLYVVLMVNLKGYEIRSSIFYKFNISSFLLSLLFVVVYRSFNSPLKLYGIILYDKFFVFFILIGVLLLVALIGCILLTYGFVYKKKNKCL